MFDTNVFGNILDGGLNIGTLSGQFHCFLTHIQRDEIDKTPDVDRRAKLLELFQAISGESVPTESFVLDASRLNEAKLGSGSTIPTESGVWEVSRWGQAKWTSEDSLYEVIRSKLDTLNKGKKNNIQDALIAETTIKNNLTLVTDDKDLATATKEMSGRAIPLQEFLEEIEKSGKSGQL